MILRGSKRIWFRICAAGLFIGVLLGCAFEHKLILTAAAKRLDVGQPPQPTDFVLVLPGGADTRPYVAAALVNAGLAQSVLLLKTRTSPDVEGGLSLASHVVEERVILARGVSPRRITILEASTDSTFADAECLAAFLARHPRATVSVVTNDYHTRRARFVFARVLRQKQSQIVFVAAPTDRFTSGDWWRRKAGLNAYFSEYLKLGFYWFRYGNGVIWTVVIASTILTAIIIKRRHHRMALGRPMSSPGVST